MNVPHIQITSAVVNKGSSFSPNEIGQECTFTFEEDVDRWDSSEGGELLEDFPMRFDDSFEEQAARPRRFGSLVRSLSSRSIEPQSQAPTNRSMPPTRGLPQRSQSMRWNFRGSFRWRKRNSGTTTSTSRLDCEEMRIDSSSSGKDTKSATPATSIGEQSAGESPMESRNEEKEDTLEGSAGDEESEECRSHNNRPDTGKTTTGEDPIVNLMAKLKCNSFGQESSELDSQCEFPSLLYDGDEEEVPNLDAQLSRVMSLVR